LENRLILFWANMKYIARKYLISLMSFISVGVANAAVSVVSTTALDPMGYGSLTLVESFDTTSLGAIPSSFAGEGYVQSISTPGQYKNPSDLNLGNGASANYFFALPRTSGYGQPTNVATSYETLWSIGRDATQLGLFWGSPDSVNTITFMNNGVALVDGTFSTSNANDPAYFVLAAGGTFNQVLFSTNNIAFEFDNLALDTMAPVPEPGEWAMMLAGLGVVSVIARKRSIRA
jgi:hypothetical protein